MRSATLILIQANSLLVALPLLVLLAEHSFGRNATLHILEPTMHLHVAVVDVLSPAQALPPAVQVQVGQAELAICVW